MNFQKRAQVQNRKLEATIAKSTAAAGNAGTDLNLAARTKSLSPGRGKRALAGDIVRNLKAKNKQLRSVCVPLQWHMLHYSSQPLL